MLVMLTNIHADSGTLAVIVSGKICGSRRMKEIESLFKDYYANFKDFLAQNYSDHTTKELSMTAPRTADKHCRNKLYLSVFA